jgi:ribonuclease BN (tRNA processing enzyme)
MKVTFYGVRGTAPVTGPDFAEYGGETTSILVEGAGGELIAVDAGTGLRILGRDLGKKSSDGSKLLFLMTHYHLDHLMGLPAFSPLYREGTRLTIAAPLRKGREPKTVISRIFSAPLWPLQIDNIPARIEFRTLAETSAAGPLSRGGLRVRWTSLHHPGGSTAYRFDEPATGTSFVFATDVEWRESSPAEQEALIKLCREPGPCGLLVSDGQYGEEEYPRFRGWGHSTRQDAVEVARRAGARKLLVTHHDPSGSDRALAEAEKQLARNLRSARLAREGVTVRLPGPRRGEKKQ